MWEDEFMRKKKLISKFMTSQSGKLTITIHILPNISEVETVKQLNLVS